MEKITQQPVAWQYRAKTKQGNVETDWHNCYENEAIRYRLNPDDGILIYEVRDLYAAPQVPRDVLMAAMREVQEQSAVFAKKHVVSEPFIRHCINLGEIADRYASKVQPSKVLETERLTFDQANRDTGNVAVVYEDGHSVTLSLTLGSEGVECGGYASKVQPVVPRECGCGWRGESDDCVWCGNVGPLCPKCHETTEEAQQPARAQPVAVPDAEIIQCFETEMARNPAAYDQLGEVVYQITQEELVRAARALLSAAQKPEGV